MKRFLTALIAVALMMLGGVAAAAEQVKIFTGPASEIGAAPASSPLPGSSMDGKPVMLEDRLNEWFKQHDKIKIIRVLQSQSGDSDRRHFVVITVFYTSEE